MRPLAIVGLGAFLLAGAAVGLRLLSLARCTRRAPETVLGLALVALCILGYPLVLLARVLEDAGSVGAEILGVLGNAGVAACVVLVAEFTRRVFHPASAVAQRAVAVVAGLEVLLVAQLELARHGALAVGADSFAIMEAVTPWVLPFLLLLAAVFGWAGVESARNHGLLRRRLALGLVEPEIVGRFLLWAVSMLAAAALILVLSALRMGGARITEHPLPMLLTAVAGLTVSVCWYLAFLPPRTWRARRARRAEGVSAG